MSLSFVSSAVQTATADGGFEEKEIESKQIDAINQRNAHKPLFEQLRQNQEEEQAKQDEMQREIMRGTRALDDEDVAHLDALEKQRLERERVLQQRTQDELLLFRAARAERHQTSLHDEDESETSDESKESSAAGAGANVVRPTPADAPRQEAVGPRIVVKKRKRRTDSGKTDPADSVTSEKKKKKEESTDDKEKSKADAKAAPASAGIGGLLAGYGSSDDERDQ